MIEVDKLSCSYNGKGWILKDLSLSVKRGEMIAIIGPNGSGKTTFLYCLSGVIPHLKRATTKGKILLNGSSMLNMKFEDITKRISFLMHNPEEQFIGLNVKHELMLGLIKSCSEGEKKTKFNEIINHFEIEELLYNTPRELSMGQKQKVIMASIFMQSPEIILLDEPFSFLDLPAQKWTVESIKELKEEGKTIIVNTHKIDMIKEIVDKVVGIKNGELSFFKPVSKLNKSDYQSLYNLGNLNDNIHKPIYKSDEMLTVKNLYFKYPQQEKWLLSNVSISISESNILGLIGKNGSGKSTLLSIVSGLIKPNKGTVSFQGENVFKMSFKDLSRKIGIVFQNPDNELFCDTVEDELSFGLKNQGLNKEEIKKRIDFVKQYFNLPDLSIDPNTLSFGWKKILSIAITMAMQPKVILLDEPDLGLDPLSQRKVIKLIMECNEEGITILVSSHDIEMINTISQEVLCLKNGEILKNERCKNELGA